MKNRVLTFHYVLKNKAGETLDNSKEAGEPLSFVEGKQEIIKGLEEEITKLKQGDKRNIVIPAAKAYGTYDATLVMDIPRNQFPKDETIEVGDQFRLTIPNKPPRVFTVTKVSEQNVNVDGNHPLAGEDLYFDVEITAVREATKEDLEGKDCCDGDHHHH